MKRNVQFLIQKRDGRREWLRATKLARSIQRALDSAKLVLAMEAVEPKPDGDDAHAVGHESDAFELAAAALHDVARRRATSLRSAPARASAQDVVIPADAAMIVTTAELAAIVERRLFAAGHARAAVCYVAARVARGDRVSGCERSHLGSSRRGSESRLPRSTRNELRTRPAELPSDPRRGYERN